MTSLLVAPDKFRGTATARDIVSFVARVAAQLNMECDGAPMADGGEGTLDVVDVPRRTTRVTGPLGQPVDAEWSMWGTTAVIEMARASGLLLAGGPEANDPLEATTAGTGELIAAALRAGADEVLVGLGGSATTDGGLGCVKALWPQTRIREVELVAATDVTTRFVDAADEFAPQKGATAAQVKLLRSRLGRLADEYEQQFGVDVRDVPGSGAAGGLGGGLLAIGARIASGFEVLADIVELDRRIEACDVVVTGEGQFDEHSMHGKVVGGVIDMALGAGKPVLLIAGRVDRSAPVVFDGDVHVVSLVERFGTERALADVRGCVEEVLQLELPSLR